MPEPKEWVTVEEAALLTGRPVRTIYAWAQDDRLASRVQEGKTVVLRKTVIRLADTLKRGRPRGTATRR